MTRHRHCRKELSLRCSLDTDVSGANDEKARNSHQLHHHGDVKQYGALLACEASVSRFEPGTSHYAGTPVTTFYYETPLYHPYRIWCKGTFTEKKERIQI